MKKTTITLSTLLILALAAGTVFAWGPGQGRGMYGSGYNQGYYQNCPNFNGRGNFADLSKEQRDELAGLRQKFIDETYDLRSDEFNTRQEIRMLVETSNPDRSKLEKLYNKVADIQKEISLKQLDTALAAKKIAPELNLGGGRGWGMGGGGFAKGGFGRHQGFFNCPGR